MLLVLVFVELVFAILTATHATAETRSGAIEVSARPVSAADPFSKFIKDPRVVVIDLSNIPGLENPDITPRSLHVRVEASSFELFQGDTRFHPARWPKAKFSRMVEPALGENRIALPAEISAQWKEEPFLWVGGYLKNIWAFETARLMPVPESQNTFSVQGLGEDGPIVRNAPFYLFNVFGALSSPGDYVIDPKNKRVYAIGVDDTGKFQVATRQTLYDISNAQDLEIKDLSLEKTLGTALRIRDSRNVTIDGCSIRHSGAGAISIERSVNVKILNCVIDDTAETAVSIDGGDRISLTPGNIVIANSKISRYGQDSRTYRPAVLIRGVGNRIENNEISNGPHSAIILNGNDHVISGNHISDVVKEADDAGAIYVGRDWTERGNIIESNLFSNIGMPDAADKTAVVGRRYISGIYLDDQESGYVIKRNVFDHVALPIVVHGGRDNALIENIFSQCFSSGIVLERRGEGLNGGTLESRLNAVPYTSPLWASRYPLLAEIKSKAPEDPVNNKEYGNVGVNCPVSRFASNTSPAYWPDLGHRSREIKTASRPSVTDIRHILQVTCGEYPALCIGSQGR
ncbi:right-handed parallel beta-helix repeat-containing protein [Neorhizobium lilium]|uniref:Right-handed parallel beta-helix repeat-containing protein n=1 Tax=Neorhizobium lilium TaxID=2503024 RepID=A0A444LED1_9HYPH|nr:right-handed parallel beta-helix repeat-containing protein [Neorhizobium lilium]RWX76514.1 right-handed parallel beta-helix repeat-containing protein [Neorhizobium lilium]